MSSRPRGSKQGSQKDRRSNADTASTKGTSSSGRSASLGGVESQTESANERETRAKNKSGAAIQNIRAICQSQLNVGQSK
jgi:hypothetical protein